MRTLRGWCHSRFLGAAKRAVKAALYDCLAPRACADSAVHKQGQPVVVGFLRAPTGVGQSARLCLNALKRLGFDPAFYDLTPRFQPARMIDDVPRGPAQSVEAKAGPLIVHANPPDLPAIFLHLGKRFVDSRPVFGYWAWELNKVPRAWIKGYEYVHEVWAPSTFCAELFTSQNRKAVRRVFNPQPPNYAEPRRATFGIPADKTVFLVCCDVNSSVARKNPIGSVEAFRRAFAGSDKALLFIKVTGTSDAKAAMRMLGLSGKDTKNMLLWTQPLGVAAMKTLYRSIDVVLSLHRAEGCGLVMVEAMLSGRCVVGTEWPGCSDFLNSSTAVLVPGKLVDINDPQEIYVNGGQWAEPDTDAAVYAIRELASNPVMRENLSRQALDATAQLCGDAAYLNAIGDRFINAASRPGGDEKLASG